MPIAGEKEIAVSAERDVILCLVFPMLCVDVTLSITFSLGEFVTLFAVEYSLSLVISVEVNPGQIPLL